MTADSADSGQLLLGTEPFLDNHLLTVQHTDVHREVTKVACELATGSADRHNACVDLARDTFGNFHHLIAVDCSHFS